MKLQLVGFITSLALVASVQAAPYITIGDSRLFLASANPLLREYIPAGQTLEKWVELAAVRVLKDQKDPKAYLDHLARQVVKDYPGAAGAQLFQSQEAKTVILDFVISSKPTKGPQFVEWNLFRAGYVEGKGLIVYQYAKRFYKDPPLTGSMWAAERQKMFKPFETATFDEVEETSK